MARPSVGLTYDLASDYAGQGLSEEDLAEFDREDTIDALAGALEGLGYRTDRIGNVHALVRRLAAGARWDLVFNIAEGRLGIGREAQVPALLDAYGIPYTFSDPLVASVTLHKATAKRILRDHGLPTPRFALVESPADLLGCDLAFPVFAKPVAEGTSKGIDARSRVDAPEALSRVVGLLLERFGQAVLVEEFLPGRELTVGIVGSGLQARAAGALEVHWLDESDPEIYTYSIKKAWETRVRYSLARDDLGRQAEELALATWRALGCRDGGRVDLRCDAAGRPSVLEVNPLPGMNPAHSDLPILWGLSGRAFQELVKAIVDSALARVALSASSAQAPCAR